MRKATWLCACAGTVLAMGSAAMAQSGETCQDAIPVVEGTYGFDSTGFATDMTSSCGGGGSADIFFAYTPSIDGVATIATCGSTFDTVVSALVDCSIELDCNDDSCGLQSELFNLPVQQGNTIFIRVARYGSTNDGGPGTLDISVAPPPPPPQWDETANGGGDAGDSISNYQTPTGTNPLTSIGGSFDTDGDVDMYLIDVCDPANFSATTYQTDGLGVDTRLFLFKTDGTGVTFNDDVPDGLPGDTTLTSYISGQFVADPGQYLLAVTTYDVTAVDADGSEIWNGTPFNVERTPDGPGALNPLASWSSSFSDIGSYHVEMTGACFANSGPACDPDVNQDGVSDQGDVDYLINIIAGGENPTGIDADFNQDGVADQGDVDALINTIASGMCP
ncbi:MAG: hypothetical protein GC200_04640 [Tepidisphaera sp.]|nr:hypothetical protein [Tepidisphaera sp.]